MTEERSPSPEPGDEQAEEAGLDAAPEGASGQARPDIDEEGRGEGAGEQDAALRDESGIADPDPEQADPESDPAASPG
jgi:hypothetical protein